MSYQLVNCRGSEYAVDWDVLERLCRSYWMSCYQLDYADVVTMSQSSWYNPFSWSMPDTRTVDVAWDHVREAASMATMKDMALYASRAGTSMIDIAYEMKGRIDATSTNRRRFSGLLRDVQSFNNKELERADKDYTGIINTLKFVRDTSADVVLIGATILSGGAAAALLGTGSVMKGAAKYQDTDKVGAAIVYGVGTLALGAFKIGGTKLSRGQEYILILAQGGLETTTSFAAGDSFSKAVEKGSLKIVSAGAAQMLFNAEWVKTIFKRIPVPFNVLSITSDGGLGDVANALTEKIVKKATEKVAKAGAEKGLELLKGSSGSSAVKSAGVASEVPLDDSTLLTLSVVNMRTGIGGGW